MVVTRGWGKGRKGDYSLLGVEFKFYKMKGFWRWMLVMIVQHHIFNSFEFVHIMKMVNFICILPQLKNTGKDEVK